MEEMVLQLKQLNAKLEPVYREILILARELQDLSVENSFEAEGDREKLARLLMRRGELLELAAARQEAAAVQGKSPRGSSARNLAPEKRDAMGLVLQGSLQAEGYRREVFRRLGLLIKEIIAVDAITCRALNCSFQDMARKLEKVQKEKKANRAYRDQGFQPEGFFVDDNK